MILERLRDFHTRIEEELIPSYHKRQGIRWILEIGADGQFHGFVETAASKKDYTDFDTPYAKRSGSKPPPYLLVDKPGYVIGLPESDDEKDLEKATERHEAYVDLLKACAEEVDHPALLGLLTFLEHHVADARAAPQTAEMNPGDLVIPRVDGVFPSKLRAVRQFWQRLQDEEAAEKSKLEAECMLCGARKPIARTHPVELLLGPDRVGLITGNKDSFLSHGLKQSEIAPLCQTCARTYGEALRYLMNNEVHRLRLSGVTWLFWTQEPTDFDFLRILSAPEPQDVRNLLHSPYRTQATQLDANAFYALAVSSNTSRLVVRSWLTTTLPEVQKHLATYFERQRMIVFDEEKTHGLFALAAATVRDLRDLPPQTAPALLLNALSGHPLPKWLLHQAVQRARAEREHTMTHPRAALIKLVLLSQPDLKEEHMIEEQLAPNHPSPAYHCGRLLAVLDDIQRTAIGARATLVDRYYGAASATPASVFGILLRKAQNHLSKLRRDKPGLGHYFEKELGEIVRHLDGFPRTLTLEEQGLFGIGFYQQRHRPRQNDGASEEERAD